MVGMKRHTYKNKKILGAILTVALVGTGVGIAANNANAANYDNGTGQETVDVKFNFDETLNFVLPAGWENGNHTTQLGELSAGGAAESTPQEISVGSNSSSGFYLSATVGNVGDANGDLKLINGGGDASISNLSTSANLANIEQASGSAWGFRYVTGSGTDIKTARYNGLPVDKGDNGSTGVKLLGEGSSSSEKTFKYQVGVKTDGSQKEGTYQNVIHFYLVGQ